MSWNKGYTKYTHLSVMKISTTMRNNHIDNFKNWRENRIKLGVIPNEFSEFKKSPQLAELIGVTLGDGNIEKCARTERLVIVGNSNNLGFINRYIRIVQRIFKKKPVCYKSNSENCYRISIYQKYISKRLGIPCGNKGHIDHIIPSWIKDNKRYLISILRGLYEAEASLSYSKASYSYNFSFCNRNDSLLKFVEDSLVLLGYHPEIRKYYVRLRKKAEVAKFKQLIKFRVY